MIFMGMSIGFGGVGVRQWVGEFLGAFYRVGSYFFEFIIYWVLFGSKSILYTLDYILYTIPKQ